jgi:two-component system response regulator CpxR
MPASASPKKVVLCVDDDEAGLRVRKMLFEAHGYEVLCSTDGRDGLRKFAENKVDAVILDYFMPEMDGGMVAAQMKAVKPEVAILMLSAYYWLPKAALLNVDAFLTKGDSPGIVLQKISELIQRPQ